MKTKENKKSEKDEEEEDDDSDSENELFDTKPKTTDGTWVVEGKTDDEIIDFLESSATKHVVSSDPAKSTQKRNVDNIFQKAEDGRFIVEDMEEEENKKKS